MNTKNLWTEKDIKFLSENVGMLTYEEIGNILGRTKDAVGWKIKELRLISKPTWTDDEVKFLKENYLKMSYTKLGALMNRSGGAVKTKANKMGLIKPDKYFYDVDFFKEINTEEKAYWLGFIMADGYVMNTGNNRRFGVQLKKCDDSHLRKFNKSINGNIDISYHTKDKSMDNNFKKDKYEMCGIYIYNKIFVEHLNKYGVVQNKTYTDLRLPSLESNFLRHLIRGYFDGDGCTTKNKKQNIPCCTITSHTIHILEEIREELYKYNILSNITQNTASKAYVLNIGGISNVNNFWEWMYKDATVYLDRKYDRYKELYEECDVKGRAYKQKNSRILNWDVSTYCLSSQ